MMYLIVLACLASQAFALAPLTACLKQGRGALCSGASPIQLRGSNYIRLAPLPPKGNVYHSTFSPQSYDRQRYNAAFEQMQHDGYNVVRVFIDGDQIGNSSTLAPFNSEYVSRVIEYVGDAATHGLYTVLTFSWLPNNAYFRNFTAGAPHIGEGFNNYILVKEYHDAWEAYAYQLADALNQGLTPDAKNAVILSLQNELFLESTGLPFRDTSVTVKCADGNIYSMANASQRQQAMDSNVNLWANRARKAWRAKLPNSLVTVGVFTYHAVGKTGPNGLMCSTKDCRFPARPYWLSRSEVDFLDVHIYQADGSLDALDANLKTEEWSSLNQSKPIIMGEFGCLGGLKGGGWYPSAQKCAAHVKNLQVSSCSRGFAGWLFWTWDTDTTSEQPQWFSMMDEAGAINGVLAPKVHPDACSTSVELV